MHWSKFLKLIKHGKTVVLPQLKIQAAAIAIGLFSVLGAYWIEPMIPQDVLALHVMIVLMSLGIALWIQLRRPRISIVCSVLAVCFHYGCHSCFVRQMVLAVMMAGLVITFWNVFNYRRSKNKDEVL